VSLPLGVQWTSMPSYKEIRERLTPLFDRRREVIAAYLFGSAAGGHLHTESDVDIALLVDQEGYEKLDRAEPYGYKAGMIAELVRTLGTDKVDLVLLHQAPPLLANEVISKGKLLFSRDEKARHEFEVSAKLRYLDTKPLREIKRRYLYERTKRGEFSKVKGAW